MTAIDPTTSTVRDIAASLGVGYVCAGGIQRADARVRINVRLIEASGEEIVWSEHYDGDLRDVFSVQELITNRIASIIAPEDTSAEIYWVQHKKDRNFDAWDLFMRANWHLSRFTKENMAECRRLCHEAIMLDPEGNEFCVVEEIRRNSKSERS